jgi:DNA-binding transcriptional MerR regulator
MIWMLGALKPDFKTIADYRKDNGDKIEVVLSRFRSFLQDHHYIEGSVVSLDGTKIRANAGKVIRIDTIESKLKNTLSQLKEYIDLLDRNDSNDDFSSSGEKEKLLKEIEDLKQQVSDLNQEKEWLESHNLKQYSPTDPECRMMKGREGKHLHYNVQATVDDKNGMLITTQATNDENDKHQLGPNVDALTSCQVTPEVLLADAGYHDTEAIQEIEKDGATTCYIPVNQNNKTLRDQENGIEFTYDQTNNQVICNEGQVLSLKRANIVDNRRNTKSSYYVGKNCGLCPKKQVCCPKTENRIKYRHEDQKWREEYEARMASPEAVQWVRKRKELSEHPFGTLKYWMGKIPLKLRGIKKVNTEITIYHIAYNLKRLANVSDFEKIVKQFRGYQWKLA